MNTIEDQYMNIDAILGYKREPWRRLERVVTRDYRSIDQY